MDARRQEVDREPDEDAHAQQAHEVPAPAQEPQAARDPERAKRGAEADPLVVALAEAEEHAPRVEPELGDVRVPRERVAHDPEIAERPEPQREQHDGKGEDRADAEQGELPPVDRRAQPEQAQPQERERGDPELWLDEARHDGQGPGEDRPPTRHGDDRADHRQGAHAVDLAPHRPDDEDRGIQQVEGRGEDARSLAPGRPGDEVVEQPAEGEVERDRQRPDRERELAAVERDAERPEQVQHRRVVRIAAVEVIAADAPAGGALGPLDEGREITAVPGRDEAGDPGQRADREEDDEAPREARRLVTWLALRFAPCPTRGGHVPGGDCEGPLIGGSWPSRGKSGGSGLSSASRRYGTFTTTVWGRPSSAARSRFADWL